MDRWIHPESVSITDLDVLALEFGHDLALTKTIAECKTGEARSGPKGFDRVLCLVGLKKLVRADRALLTMTRPVDARVREVAAELGIEVQDVNDLERRERLLGIDRHPHWGSHDPAFLKQDDQVRAALKTDAELTRIYWIFRSEAWVVPPSLALKRSVTAIGILGKRWEGEDKLDRRRLYAWLLGDAVVTFSVAAVQLAANAVKMPQEAFRTQTGYRLSEGLTSIGELARLSRAVDEYVAGILRRAGLPETTIVSALGAFDPTPPDYLEPLLELLERLAERAHEARQLPVLLDLAVAYRIRRREWELPDLRLWHLDEFNGVARLGRTMLAFLQGQADLPAEFARLLDERPSGRGGAELFGPPGQAQLQLESAKASTATPERSDGAPQS